MAPERRIVTMEEFSKHNQELVKDVQKNRTELVIADAGTFVARIVPMDQSSTDEAIVHDLAIMRKIDRIAEAYDDMVPEGASAVEMINDQRRD